MDREIRRAAFARHCGRRQAACERAAALLRLLVPVDGGAPDLRKLNSSVQLSDILGGDGNVQRLHSFQRQRVARLGLRMRNFGYSPAAVQLVCLIGLYFVKSTAIGISFPVFIGLLPVVRHLISKCNFVEEKYCALLDPERSASTPARPPWPKPRSRRGRIWSMTWPG